MNSDWMLHVKWLSNMKKPCNMNGDGLCIWQWMTLVDSRWQWMTVESKGQWITVVDIRAQPISEIFFPMWLKKFSMINYDNTWFEITIYMFRDHESSLSCFGLTSKK